MIKRFSTNFGVASMLIDAGLLVVVLWLMSLLRPELVNYLPVRPVGEDFYLPAWLYLVFPLVWVIVLGLNSVYDGNRNLKFIEAFSRLTLGAMGAGIALAGILFLTYRDLSRALFLIFFLFAYLALLGWRLIYLSINQGKQLTAASQRRLLLVGRGKLAHEFQHRLAEEEQSDFNLVGCVDNARGKKGEEPPYLGELAEIEDVIQAHQISDVVIALAPSQHQETRQIVTALENLAVKVWLIPDSFQMELQRTRSTDLAGLAMLELRAPALDENQRFVKRLFDLVATVLILVPALPVMLLTALAVLFVDGWPILYFQQRVGEDGKLFTFYKFRTMMRGADKLLFEVAEPDGQGKLILKHKDDPRVTRLGAFLRRFSLDELPQLFNVLKGDMSLVGPRPELPELVENYQPWQRVRFSVPQGITGWWQIYGRSDKPMYLNTEEDLYYIQHYTFGLDLQILVKTIWVVLNGKGAY